MNILEELAQKAQELTEQKKKELPLEVLIEKVDKESFQNPSFEEALRSPGISFICELKKASPSKGLISKNFDYLRFAEEYENNGASAISCLTEPTKFLGSLEILKDVTLNVNIPVLRKDFIVDPYQIYEAKLNGASAILLIVALLDTETLKNYLELADSLGLSSLVEVHDSEELSKALEAGARIIGVNNRNLKDFTVTLNTSKELAQLIPEDKVFVSESGIHSKKDLEFLESLGVDAVLIGEQFMASPSIPEAMKELIGNED